MRSVCFVKVEVVNALENALRGSVLLLNWQRCIKYKMGVESG